MLFLTLTLTVATIVNVITSITPIDSASHVYKKNLNVRTYTTIDYIYAIKHQAAFNVFYYISIYLTYMYMFIYVYMILYIYTHMYVYLYIYFFSPGTICLYYYYSTYLSYSLCLYYIHTYILYIYTIYISTDYIYTIISLWYITVLLYTDIICFCVPELIDGRRVTWLSFVSCCHAGHLRLRWFSICSLNGTNQR